jgi:adenylyl-sulfate kinase
MGQGAVIWLTGISGAGKSTLARALHSTLSEQGVRCEYIDGEDVREFFGHDLEFSRGARLVNLKRIVYAAELLARHGVVTIVAAIAPHYEGRDFIRGRIKNYIQVYVNVPLEVARQRDTKGHYKNCELGREKNFVGVDDVYEVPRRPDVVVHSDRETPGDSLAKILAHLRERGLIN